METTSKKPDLGLVPSDGVRLLPFPSGSLVHSLAQWPIWPHLAHFVRNFKTSMCTRVPLPLNLMFWTCLCPLLAE